MNPDELSVLKFIKDRLSLCLWDFCFFLSHHLNRIKPGKGDKYRYIQFENLQFEHQCLSIVKKASNYGEITYLAFFIILYLKKYTPNSKIPAEYTFYENMRITDEYRQLENGLKNMPFGPIAIRISDFLCERLDLEDLLNNAITYPYNPGNAAIENKRRCNLFVDFFETHDDLYTLVFVIAIYWFEQKKAETSVLLNYFFHEDLCYLYTKNKEKKIAKNRFKN